MRETGGDQMNSEFDSKQVLLVFGSNIRKEREKQGLTISELSDSIGYDRGCLSSLEYGEQNIEYNTALNLARKLNISFPILFSRNYLDNFSNSTSPIASGFNEDDYLLVFIENFQKLMKKKGLRQIDAYGETNIQTALISRIINRKISNPTIKTLSAMAYTVDTEMYYLFSRNSQEEII